MGIPAVRKTCLTLLLCTFACPLFAKAEPEIVLEGSRSTYGRTDILAGMSFPPYSNDRQIEFTLEEMDRLAVDRMRIAIDWRNREPERGAFYWEPMDRRMKAAEDNGVSVFLTIASLCPDWARLPGGEDGACLMDEEALGNFIEEILKRYGSIDKIQFGNEWETGTPDGTAYLERASVEKFVIYTNILYDKVQALSPETVVVLGGLTRTWPMAEAFLEEGRYPDFSGLDLAKGASVEWLHKRLDKLGANYTASGIRENVEYVLAHARYDIIDIHLYDDPENWPAYLSVLPRDKPILVSEFGGPNSEFENTDPAYQAERMHAYLNAIEELPILEAYWFKLVDSRYSYHQDSGLFSERLKAKPAREVFAERLTPIDHRP